jgi:hypothetical protein
MRFNSNERSKQRERRHLAAIKRNSGKTWQELAEVFVVGSGKGDYGDAKELSKKMNQKNSWFSAGKFKQIDAIAVSRGWCKPYLHWLLREPKSKRGRPASEEHFDEDGLPVDMPDPLKKMYLVHEKFVESAIALESRINQLILAKEQFELAKVDYESVKKFEIHSNAFTERDNQKSMRDYLILALKDELLDYEKVIENSSLSNSI